MWTAVGAPFRWLNRPLGWLASYLDVFTLAFGGIAAILALAHSAQFPDESAWASGEPLLVAQIAFVVVWIGSQVCLAVQGKRRRRNQDLEDACRAVAAFVDDRVPSLPLSEVGVHIWQVRMIRKSLRRAGSFLLIGDRARSGIGWTSGKGVVGRAWKQSSAEIKDLEAIRRRAGTQEEFEALGEEDQLGLTWEEFRKTPRYRAVYARPLYSRDGRDHLIKGIIAIDLLSDGHYADLKAATESVAFDGVVGVCESALNA